MRDVIALIKNPIFLEQQRIEKIFSKNRNKEKYKLIMDIYFQTEGSHALAENCQHKIALFLSDPSYKNYLELYSNESAIANDACWSEIKRDVHNLARLYKYTTQGNEWAIKILLEHTSDLDGGELEDAYIALGESFDSKPRVLLREFKKRRMTENQFTQALLMLPLSLTDDVRGELTALKARKKTILSIKDAALNHQKKMAAKVLDSQIEQIINELP